MVGAFVGLDIGAGTIDANRAWTVFNRNRDGIVAPKVELLEHILNHFRVISVEAFRYIPQNDLRDIHGRYF
jgi:hypothetical protein